MAPKRRTTRSSTAASGGRQTPLSFGASKITKPGAVQSAKEVGKSAGAKKVEEVAELSQPSTHTTPLLEEKQVPVSDVDSARDESPLAASEATTLLTLRDSKPAEGLVTPKSTTAEPKANADEIRAKDISEARIKKYWKGKEDARIVPRVHQEGLSLHEKVLREFDLSSQYGPCIGIGRSKRWHRAQKLKLDPPIEVLAVLVREVEQEKGNKKKRTSGGSDDGRPIGVQVAYVDELMGAKDLVDEVR